MFDCELKFALTQEYNNNYIINHHDHPCYEIVYYLQGEGKTEIAGKSYAFCANTFSIIEPNKMHNEAGLNVKVLYIGFNVLTENPELKSGIYSNKDINVLDNLEKILMEMENKSNYYSRMLNILTEELVIKLNRFIAFHNSPQKDKSISYILNFIKLNCMKNINVHFLANTFGYNYDYFRKLFFNTMHISVKDYIMREKFSYSLDLMQNSNYSIKEIAGMCGFSTPSHYGMYFKEQLNMTPKKYLIKLQNGELHKEISNYNGKESTVFYNDKAVKTEVKN